MKFSHHVWAFACAFSLLFVSASVVNAQGLQTPAPTQEIRTDFTDEQLEQFVSASQKAQEVQQARQQEMMAAIQGEDLDVQRFNEIMAVQQGQKKDGDVSEEEMASFNAAAQKVMEQQRLMQTEIAESIEEVGISMDTFQQISMAYQQSPEVQEKVTEILEGQ